MSENQTSELFYKFYDYIDGYQASSVMSAGFSIAIFALSEMIKSDEDLKTVLNDLDERII